MHTILVDSLPGKRPQFTVTSRLKLKHALKCKRKCLLRNTAESRNSFRIISRLIFDAFIRNCTLALKKTEWKSHSPNGISEDQIPAKVFKIFICETDFAEKHYSWKMIKCKKPLWLLDFGFEGQKRLPLYWNWGAGHSSSSKEIMSKDQKKYCRQVSQKNQSHHWSNQIRYKRNSTSEILREQKLQIPHCKIEIEHHIRIYLRYHLG